MTQLFMTRTGRIITEDEMNLLSYEEVVDQNVIVADDDVFNAYMQKEQEKEAYLQELLNSNE